VLIAVGNRLTEKAGLGLKRNIVCGACVHWSSVLLTLYAVFRVIFSVYFVQLHALFRTVFMTIMKIVKFVFVWINCTDVGFELGDGSDVRFLVLQVHYKYASTGMNYEVSSNKEGLVGRVGGKGKRWRHNTYIAPQAATAATVALYVTG